MPSSWELGTVLLVRGVSIGFELLDEGVEMDCEKGKGIFSLPNNGVTAIKKGYFVEQLKSSCLNSSFFKLLGLGRSYRCMSTKTKKIFWLQISKHA